MDVEQILDIVHQTAAEMMAAKDGEVVEHGSAVSTEGADSLIDRYGFSSIDALECLLILEGKFGITLADEDLNERGALLGDRTGQAHRHAPADAGLRFAPVIGSGERLTRRTPRTPGQGEPHRPVPGDG